MTASLRDTHLSLIERFRGSMNLVGPGSARVHDDDAMEGLAVIDPPPTGRWADLGTGAGFPGIALADTWPGLRVDLVDSRQKRCAFLEHVVDAAAVRDRVRVVCARVETLEDGVYDGVVTRAFAPPDGVLEHAARLLAPGGRAVLWLNAHQTVPEHPAFAEGPERPYTRHGKERKVVVRWRR